MNSNFQLNFQFLPIAISAGRRDCNRVRLATVWMLINFFPPILHERKASPHVICLIASH